VVGDEVNVLLERGGRGGGRAEDDALVVNDVGLGSERGGVELAGKASVDGPFALLDAKDGRKGDGSQRNGRHEKEKRKKGWTDSLSLDEDGLLVHEGLLESMDVSAGLLERLLVALVATDEDETVEESRSAGLRDRVVRTIQRLHVRQDHIDERHGELKRTSSVNSPLWSCPSDPLTFCFEPTVKGSAPAALTAA
jgi:hypothetical protein